MMATQEFSKRMTPPRFSAAQAEGEGETSIDLPTAMREVAGQVDEALQQALPDPVRSGLQGPLGQLRDAQRHAALGGGKRVRGCLAVACADMYGAPRDRSMRLAAGIECLHAYSLVHDDLPAMDGDDLRRGQPTVHRAYGEAMAILAGDALQSLAFEILAAPDTHPDPSVRARLALDLARAAGAAGMAGGQAMDIDPRETEEYARAAQRRKTGALLEYSCAAGGVLGEAAEDDVKALVDFGRAFGLAYQIRDDLLDVEGDPALVGKRLRKDSAAGKATLVEILGRENARSESMRLRESALEAVARFGDKAAQLREILGFAIVRMH